MPPSISSTLQSAAARCGCDADEVHRFNQHLQALPASRAARINPYEFADMARIDRERTIDLFVHCTKLGLFDLEWGMVCPLCGAIVRSVAKIDLLAEDAVHCCICNKDAESLLDDTIEVSFAYSPPGSAFDLHGDYEAYQDYFTSSSHPYGEQLRNYRDHHAVGDVRIEPAGQANLPLNLQAGEAYRLLCLDTHSGAEIQVNDEGSLSDATEAPRLSLSEAGFSAPAVDLPVGAGALALTNDTDQTVWIRALRIDMNAIGAIINSGPPQFGPRLTGKHLLNNQAFRDCFALNELAPDLKLKLRNLTLLFTDLKGSTALYDREGDLAAYRLVQDHFAALKKAVGDNSGAVIKTMGDAVMAAFPSGEAGTAAAVAMMVAMQEIAKGRTEDDVGLKVGLHAGPALAINSGNNVDYFGQTVNIAARVQGLADAGDICVTGALNDEDAIPALLNRSGYVGQSEVATLKGVSAAERVYRYRNGLVPG
jgi:class 3 adenylate cyclase